MASQLLVEGQGKALVRTHRCLVQQSLGLVPLPGSHCSIDGLHGVACLDVVVDGSIHLPLRHEPVAPLLLQGHHQARLGVLRQLDGLSVGVSPTVRVHGRLNQTHSFVEATGTVMHSACLKPGNDLLQELLGVVCIMSLDHRCSLCSHTPAQVQFDSPDVVAVNLLKLACLLLLLCGKQPLQVVVLQVHELGMVLALCKLYGLVVLVQLLVHGQCFIELVVIQQNSFSALELLRKHGHLRLGHVVVGAITTNLCCMILNQPVDLVQVPALCYVAQDGIAAFGYRQVEVLHRGISQ
mmetsp:Transcript_62888/g.150200  ORF Transcript_62888/g.150200 Transcript_62888/m.150200 type:complete len:295 (+) Transcript_62888:2562-3446(+)